MVDRIAELTEILPYVREFLGKIFVIKLGGEVCGGKNLDQIAQQVSLIHHMGIKVVLVHGGGPQLNEVCETLGIEKQVIAGRRITDDSTLRAAKMVFKGLVGSDVVSALKLHGASAVGLSGLDAGLILADRRAPKPVVVESGEEKSIDFGNVGDITKINPKILEVLLSSNMIPVICSLGGTESGDVLNINADTVASSLAQALQAEKLIVMTNVPGILERKEEPSSLVSYSNIQNLQRMVRDGIITDGMLPKVEACMQAVLGGVSRTHIINGTRAGSILMELFLNEGCGTMIVNDIERKKYEEEVEAAA